MQIAAADSPVLAEPPSISTRFMWERDEHRRLIRQITIHAQAGKSIRNTYLTLGGIWLVIVMIPILMGDWRNMRAIVPWLLILVFWTVLFRFGAPWLAARAYPKQHPCVSDPFGVTLDGEGIRSTCNHSDALTKWEGVRRAIETREFFLFFYTDRCAVYLPKRAVASPGELERARELILTHVALRDETKR